MAIVETAEEISSKPEVRQALSQTSGPKASKEPVKVATKDKFWFVTHVILLVSLAVLYYLVCSRLIPVPHNTFDHPSVRIIKFPNSRVLNEMVFNYSWPLFPYIWNEIKFQIAYNADLQFVARTMQKITEEEIGEEMLERVAVFRELLGKTPVDEL